MNAKVGRRMKDRVISGCSLGCSRPEHQARHSLGVQRRPDKLDVRGLTKRCRRTRKKSQRRTRRPPKRPTPSPALWTS